MRKVRVDAITSPYCEECGREISGWEKHHRRLCPRCDDRAYGRDVECAWCGVTFRCLKSSWNAAQRAGRTTLFCSKSCAGTHAAWERDPAAFVSPLFIKPCETCSTWWVGNWDNPWCMSEPCTQERREAARRRYYDKHRDEMLVRLKERYATDLQFRARVVGRTHQRRFDQVVPLITILDIADRDGWDCYWCDTEMLKMPRFPRDPEQASIEHVDRVEDGGPHHMGNVVLAHLRCNLS